MTKHRRRLSSEKQECPVFKFRQQLPKLKHSLKFFQGIWNRETAYVFMSCCHPEGNDGSKTPFFLFHRFHVFQGSVQHWQHYAFGRITASPGCDLKAPLWGRHLPFHCLLSADFKDVEFWVNYHKQRFKSKNIHNWLTSTLPESQAEWTADKSNVGKSNSKHNLNISLRVTCCSGRNTPPPIHTQTFHKVQFCRILKMNHEENPTPERTQYKSPNKME